MKDLFESFIFGLLNDVPYPLYIILIFILLLFSIIFFLTFGKGKTFRLLLSRFTLGEYVFLIYSSTVLFRTTKQYQEPNLTPFWKYKTYDNMGNMYLLPEIIMNLVVFIPFGYLFGMSFSNIKLWQVLMMGFLVSISIEFLQFFYKLGMAEFDDVFHNTLGVAIGYSLYKLIYFVLNKTRRFHL